MTRRAGHRAAVLALLVTVVSACGSGSGLTPPGVTPTPAASPLPPSPSPLASPSPKPSPRPTARPAAIRFTTRVTASPGARIRFGPALDMPVRDLLPAGASVTVDARIYLAEQWLRVAGGRGWIRRSSVAGDPPAALPQVAWTRPASPPAPAAALLEVPFDFQDRNATCEVASLKMALGYRGIAAGEVQLLGRVGVDPRPPEVDDLGGIVRWADPARVFVGEPDGSLGALTGYGVYAGPIARVAREQGARVLVAGTGIAPPQVYAALLQGHPVVAWVTSDYRRGELRKWTAWDGAIVQWAPHEHAVTVIGVTAGQVVINDPWWGVLWKSRAQFEAAYATFENMAVVLE